MGAPDPSRPEVVIYPYLDDAGQVAFEGVRIIYSNRAECLQYHRPSGEGDQSWLWSLEPGEFMRPAPGNNWFPFDAPKFEGYPATRERKFFDTAAPIIPYQLRELRKAVADNCPIFICKDEDEADFLRSRGLCATCCARGAKAWRAEHARFLQGANVVLTTGQDHAKILAESLASVARRMRILENDAVLDLRTSGDTKKFLASIAAAHLRVILGGKGDHPLEPDRDEAERFLTALDRTPNKLTFQTFDDFKKRRKERAETNKLRKQQGKKELKDPFANIEHGTLAHHFEWLVNENKRGAGIYVCINETDLKGRATENVKRIRAGYIDLDGAPLDPVNKAKLRAHIITETSPGRYQAYWIIGDDMPLEEFKPLQKGLIAYFNGDPAVHDLPRVMRIPGFIHNKEGTPFLSRIVQINDIPPYKWEELREAFPPPATKKNQVALEAPLEFDMPFEYLGEGLPSAPSDLREQWKKLNSEAIKRYSDWVPDIFPAASSTSNGGYRVSSADLGRDLEEDLSFHADGIKDFGVHDMGDPREGRRTPIDIVKEHLHKDFTEAVRWLAEKLGLDPRDYLPKPKPENDSPPLLYPRDEVDEQIALGHTILVAKDKKDADRLWSIGVPATCSAHGEWTPKHSEQLRSADIVVLGNHDAACKFSLGIAKRVRILKLADVSDWLDTGHTREELDELIEHAPDYAPTASSLGEWDAGDEPGIIPPRQWLLGNQFCRGFISSIVATGGAGKSALRLLQFISMALGRSLCGQHVFRRSRVLLISLEDDRDELQRRIKAVLDHYGIDRKELKGWLFCASPKLAKLAEMKNRTRAIGPLEQHIRDAIKRRNPDIVSLDPFIKTHGLEENDSGDMDFVCDLLARMAIEFNIAVDSPHHAHKGQVTPGDADSGRGSSGIRDAGRLVYTLAPMSEADAKIFNIKAENRRSYVRLDSAKVNIAAPSAKAEWFHIIGQPIGNSTDEYPNGDIIQVVEPWSPPDAWKDTTPIGLNAILTDIDHGLTDEDGNPTGQRYSNAPQSSRPGSLASRPKTTTPISPKPQSSTHGSTPSCSTPMIASTQSPVKNAKGLKSIMPNAHPEYFPQNAPSTIFLPPPARGNMCPPCVTGRKSAIEQKAPVAVRLRHSAAAMAQAFAPCFLL